MKKLLLFVLVAINAHGGNGLDEARSGKVASKTSFTFFEEARNYVSEKTCAFIMDHGTCQGFKGPEINIKKLQKQQNRLEHHELEAKPMHLLINNDSVAHQYERTLINRE